MTTPEIKTFLSAREVPVDDIPDDATRREVVKILAARLPADLLAALPEIRQNARVRKEVHQDILDALQGDMTEADREEGAIAASKKETEESPTRADLDLLEKPAEVHPVLSNDGSTVDGVVITRWVQGPDGKPVQEQVTEGDQSVI